MSLSSFLSRPEVRRHLASVIRMPAPIETFYGKVHVALQSDLAPLIGTAFDYLMRFRLERLNPGCISRPWVAEFAAPTLHQQLRPSARGGQTRLGNAAETVADTVKRCRLQQQLYLNSGEVTPKLLAAVVEIAQVDHFVRSRSDTICLVPSEAAQRELASLYDAIPTHYFVARRECLLNPTFGAGSALVEGADADVLLDQTLIEIKVTATQQVTAAVFQQLISYVALAEIGGIDGQSEAQPIESIGVYSARHACYHAWHVEDIVPHDDLVRLASWFLIHAGVPDAQSW